MAAATGECILPWHRALPSSRRSALLRLAVLMSGACGAGPAAAQGRAAGAPAVPVTPLAGNERVDLFTTAARRGPDGGWIVPVEGRVFRPERSTARLALVRRVLRTRYAIDPDAAGRDVLEARVNLLLGDGRGSRRITVEVAGTRHALPPSEPSGRVAGVIAVGDGAVDAAGDRLAVRVVLPARDPRLFAASALLLPPEGLSVISDIDDTVKVTGVGNRRQLLESSLVKPFTAVPGMARRYQRWAAEGAAFHFVSSTPWQLHAPLAVFLAEAGFPPATIDLKVLSFNDPTLLDLLASPAESKPPRIAALLDAFPRRSFVLVGDSGEKDPEIYADIARRRPGRIALILIRNVTGARADDARMSAAFAGLERERWQLFDDPSEMPGSLRR